MPDHLERLAAALHGRYTIERELGRGGMATVYLAEDVKHHRQVAVKVMHPELAEAVGPERFLREIETTANLRHPHILPLYDSGEADGLLFYVMPYVEGETLRARIDREKQLPIDEALDIAREVADALSFAHSRNVVHRDIKPENILLESGHAVVADFGIARAVSVAGGEGLTATGVAVGTPSYMSPEQAGGTAEVDGRSDVYSLGCVLYEMLGGQPPFVGPTVESVVRQHVAVDPPPITNLRPGISDEVAGALARALAKTPADRFNPAAQFGDELRRAAPHSTVETTAPKSRKLRVPYGVVAAFLLVVLVWFGGRLVGDGDGAVRSDVPRVVVLPFENLGPAEDDYFADGMTEEITARLATISDLAVIARASANQYRETAKSLAEIARELRVDYVLQGSVRWQRVSESEQQVRVTPQLIRVADETQIWANVYDGEMSRVFEVQAHIAEHVRSSLDVALSPTGDVAAVTTPPTDDLEAYILYLRANSALDDATVGTNWDYRQAIELYEQTVAIDPGFVKAWSRLAYARAIAHWTGNPGDHLPAAERAVSRALALDPSSPDARIASGYVRYYGYRNYEGALEEFLAARESMPGDADLLDAMALINRRLGNWERSSELHRQAVALDPRSRVKVANAASTFMVLRRYDEAQELYATAIDIDPRSLSTSLQSAGTWLAQGDRQRANEVAKSGFAAAGIGISEATVGGTSDPDFWVLRGPYLLDGAIDAIREMAPAAWTQKTAYHLMKGHAFHVSKDAAQARAHYDSAVVTAREELSRSPDNAEARARLAMALAGAGQKAEAIQQGRRAQALLPVAKDAIDGARLTWLLGYLYIKVGEYDAAIDQFEAALAIPSEMSKGLLRIDPAVEPLRGMARFQRLIEGG